MFKKKAKDLSEILPPAMHYDLKSEGEKYEMASIEEKVEDIKEDAKSAALGLLKIDDEAKRKEINDKFVAICTEKNKDVLMEKLSEFVAFAKECNVKKYLVFRMLKSKALFAILGITDDTFIKKFILGVDVGLDKEHIAINLESPNIKAVASVNNMIPGYTAPINTMPYVAPTPQSIVNTVNAQHAQVEPYVIAQSEQDVVPKKTLNELKRLVKFAPRKVSAGTANTLYQMLNSTYVVSKLAEYKAVIDPITKTPNFVELKNYAYDKTLFNFAISADSEIEDKVIVMLFSTNNKQCIISLKDSSEIA